jgi:hypothetical protein
MCRLNIGLSKGMTKSIKSIAIKILKRRRLKLGNCLNYTQKGSGML